MAKNSFLHLFFLIPQTIWPLWIKFGRNIYHGVVHAYVNFQVHISISFGRIAKKPVFRYFTCQAITPLLFILWGWFLVSECIWLIRPGFFFILRMEPFIWPWCRVFNPFPKKSQKYHFYIIYLPIKPSLLYLSLSKYIYIYILLSYVWMCCNKIIHITWEDFQIWTPWREWQIWIFARSVF